MSEYYGGAPNAFAGGMEYGATLRARRIRENALNSLIQRYGPIAGDPATAAAMQGISERQAAFPYEQAEAQRVDAAHNAEVSELGVTAGDPQSYSRVSAEKLEAGRRAAAVLKLTKARGGDLGKAFDIAATLLPHFGVPAARLASARASVVSDPDSVDELVALLDPPPVSRTGVRAVGQPVSVIKDGRHQMMVQMSDGSRQFIDTPMTSAVQGDKRLDQGQQRIGLGWKRLEHDEMERLGYKAPTGYQGWLDENGDFHATPIVGSEEERKAQTDIQEADQGDKTFIRSANLVRRNASIVRENAQRAIDYFSKADGGVLLQNLRRGAPLVAGTDMFNANQALENVRGKMAVSTLEEMRKSSKTGSSGFGQLTAPELNLLKDSQGALSTISDPKILVSTLQDILEAYSDIEEYANNDATAARQRLNKRSAQYPNQTVPRRPTSKGPTPDSDDDPLGIRQ